MTNGGKTKDDCRHEGQFMGSHRKFIALISFIGPVLSAISASAQDLHTDPAAAEALFKRGVEDMRAGRFEAACPLIAESRRLDPRPGSLFTLAECEAHAGLAATAVVHYREFLRLVEGMTQAQKLKQATRAHDAEEQIKILEPEVPSLTLVLPKDSPSGVEVTRDGIKLGMASIGIAISLDPGEHVLITQLPSGEKAEQKIVVEKREKKTLELKIPVAAPGTGSLAKPEPVVVTEPPKRPWQKPTAIGVLALGGVGVAVGGALGGLAIAKNGESNSGPCNSQNVCNGDGLRRRNEALTFATGSTIAIIAGGALLAGGVVLFATTPRTTKHETGASRGSLNARLEAGVGSVRLRGTW